jgi:hypothetical protein
MITMFRTPIVTYGQFVVLGLLFLETALFVGANMRFGTGGTEPLQVSARKA